MCRMQSQGVSTTELIINIRSVLTCGPRFAKWKDLPVIVDDELAKLVPSTTEILTEAERRNEKGPGKRDRREQRTRFHVKSVMALHESQKSSREAKASKKERGTWMKQQKAVWRKVEEVGEIPR